MLSVSLKVLSQTIVFSQQREKRGRQYSKVRWDKIMKVQLKFNPDIEISSYFFKNCTALDIWKSANVLPVAENFRSKTCAKLTTEKFFASALKCTWNHTYTRYWSKSTNESYLNRKWCHFMIVYQSAVSCHLL